MSFNYLSDIWENSNKKIKEEENYREIFSPAKKFIGKKKYFDFSSNDYLGLRNNKEIIEAGYASALQNGAGAGSSRLVMELDNNISLLEKYFAEQNNVFISVTPETEKMVADLFKETKTLIVTDNRYLNTPNTVAEADIIVDNIDTFRYA